MPSSRINSINDDIKPVVETVIDKWTAMRATYEKARVAKRAAKYGILYVLPRFGQIKGTV